MAIFNSYVKLPEDNVPIVDNVFKPNLIHNWISYGMVYPKYPINSPQLIQDLIQTIKTISFISGSQMPMIFPLFSDGSDPGSHPMPRSPSPRAKRRHGSRQCQRPRPGTIGISLGFSDWKLKFTHMAMDQYLLGPIHTIFRGMNIHKSQLF